MALRRREKIIASGEMRGPDGFRAETANGTAYATGTGWNKEYDWSMRELPADPVRPAGRSNRTGE
jgi:hypothetical protein